MKMLTKLSLGAGALVASVSSFAAGTVPTALQAAITSASDDGVAIVTAVAVGMALIGLLARAYGKAGVR